MNEIEYDGWMFPRELFEYIRTHLVKGKTILEFGSGNGTKLLLQKWNVISIEHNPEWVITRKGKFNHIMIEAKIVDCKTKGWNDEVWYDSKIIEKSLIGLDYDMIIIDGPTGNNGRAGIVKYMNKLKQDVPIIMDDLQKLEYIKIFRKISKNRQVKYIKAKSAKHRMFGVIL